MIPKNYKTNGTIYVESYEDTSYISIGIHGYSGLLNKYDVGFLYKALGEIVNVGDGIN